MTNKFISFEGIDGCGKSTQSKRLYDYLIEKGHDVVYTREIGGTPLAEKIRDIVVNNDMSRNTELLLIMAARNDHIQHVIKPALDAGKWVICDRFVDSTVAYQSCHTADDVLNIYTLHESFFGDLYPDLTFYLQIDYKTAIDRATIRGNVNKFEAKDPEFFEDAIRTFDYISHVNQQYIKCINATHDEDTIFEQIIRYI